MLLLLFISLNVTEQIQLIILMCLYIWTYMDIIFLFFKSNITVNIFVKVLCMNYTRIKCTNKLIEQ